MRSGCPEWANQGDSSPQRKQLTEANTHLDVPQFKNAKIKGQARDETGCL